MPDEHVNPCVCHKCVPVVRGAPAHIECLHDTVPVDPETMKDLKQRFLTGDKDMIVIGSPPTRDGDFFDAFTNVELPDYTLGVDLARPGGDESFTMNKARPRTP